MTNKQYDRGQLAALALFRELYDQQTDVYSVLHAFLEDIIFQNRLFSFTTNKINKFLRSTYEFEIPDAVINTALNRIKNLKKAHGNWSIDNLPPLKVEIQAKRDEILQSHEDIKNQIIKFMEDQFGRPLQKNEINDLLASFSSFLLEEKVEDKYLTYITAFIIANEVTPGFRVTLNRIREGLILYAGLKHNNNINEKGTWDKNLTIFLDTEILFHFAGYNGEICKKWFMDMYRFIQEANSKSKTRLIELRYLPNAREEINKFFNAAEMVVTNILPNDPSKTAMQAILNGCQSGADVIEKKAIFYELLSKFQISEENADGATNEEMHQYWIYNQEVVNRLELEFQGKPVEEYLSCLNKIAILRKGYLPKNLEDAQVVLISGKTAVLHIARDTEIKPNGSFPLAISMHYITSTLWFKLNRGFGKNQYPESFDVIAKAQMTLSTKVSESLHEKFCAYKKKVDSKEISKTAAAAIIVHLRRETRRPEDINHDNAIDGLHFVNTKDIDAYTENYDLALERIENFEKQKSDLHEEIKEKNKLLHENEKASVSFHHDALISMLSKNTALLEEITTTKDLISSNIKKANKVANRKYLALRVLCAFNIFTLSVILTELLVVFNIGYNNLKVASFFTAFVFEYFLLVLFSIFTTKEWSYKDFHHFLLNSIILRIKSEHLTIIKNEYKNHDIIANNLDTYTQKIEDLQKENDGISEKLANIS